jgi:hypothetical protein
MENEKFGIRNRFPLFRPFKGALLFCGTIKIMERVNIFIEIQSSEESLGSELIKIPKRFDRKLDLPADVILMKVHPSDVNGVEGKNMFLLSFGSKVAPSLLAYWLYEKIHGRATRLDMDRIEIPINKAEIERIITEKITKNQCLKKETTRT